MSFKFDKVNGIVCCYIAAVNDLNVINSLEYTVQVRYLPNYNKYAEGVVIKTEAMRNKTTEEVVKFVDAYKNNDKFFKYLRDNNIADIKILAKRLDKNARKNLKLIRVENKKAIYGVNWRVDKKYLEQFRESIIRESKLKDKTIEDIDIVLTDSKGKVLDEVEETLIQLGFTLEE